jgi:hypothetical protein
MSEWHLVSELTRNADIKLNEQVSLRRHAQTLSYRTGHYSSSGHTREAAGHHTLGGFCFPRGQMMISSDNFVDRALPPRTAWTEVWHLWTVVVPRRSITGRLVYGRVWRRRDGRHWIYKKFVEYEKIRRK